MRARCRRDEAAIWHNNVRVVKSIVVTCDYPITIYANEVKLSPLLTRLFYAGATEGCKPALRPVIRAVEDRSWGVSIGPVLAPAPAREH